MDRRANNECPDCGEPFLYAVEDEEGALYVHGFEYFEELDDLIKQVCHVSDGDVPDEKHTVEQELHESTFSLDIFPDETFRGYTSGKRWKGGACPLFPKEEAERIAEAFDGFEDPYEGGKHWAAYDPQADAFVFYDPTHGEWGVYHGVDVEGTMLYPIGTYA